MKILVDDNIPYIQGRLEPYADIEYLDQFAFTPDNVKDADALMIRTRTRCDEGLLKDSSVRLIATATIGTDQIDIPWCENNGITVANAPGCNAPAVAQYVWASLLRLGIENATTIGIIGCGNVGSIVAAWGLAMGFRILVSDPPRQYAGLPPIPSTTDSSGYEGNGSIRYATLEEIMAQADAVTIHTPLIREGQYPTYHLLGDKEFSLMQQGAILVNAARGPVIDSTALLLYLKERKIRAVIDTWEGEPYISTELLETVEIGTFHIAGYSRQGKERATRMAIEAIERFFGINIDKSGLEGPYIPPKRIIPEAILGSYDPYADSDALKAAYSLQNPSSPASPASPSGSSSSASASPFDLLRRNYDYRPEVPF